VSARLAKHRAVNCNFGLGGYDGKNGVASTFRNSNEIRQPLFRAEETKFVQMLKAILHPGEKFIERGIQPFSMRVS
jgi:hypothetical protein